MQTLEDRQLSFATTIRSKSDENLGALNLYAGPVADPSLRVRIYRNNMFSSLTEALLAKFPVTARLVDERFFRFAAHEYIASHPPVAPQLSVYGASFPAFLHCFRQLRDMPFVAETARLEFLIAEALEEPALFGQPITGLTWHETPEDVFLRLQPSLRLLGSRWPVSRIWAAHQQEEEADLTDIYRGEVERLAIWRSRDRIRVVEISQGERRLWSALTSGRKLGEATSRALSLDRHFDLAAALTRLFALGLVTRITSKPD
jgi:hypothetical protein